MTSVKSVDEIQVMREGGAMLATVLTSLEEAIRPGMSTKDLAVLAKEELRKLGGQPTILGYGGFPDVICISVNDEVVHGIPRADVILSDGDIVGLDFCVTHKGLVTDSARSVVVGRAAPEVEQMLKVTEQALYAGIDACKDGVRVGEISAAIQEVLDNGGYGIVRDLVGHGVGHEMHEDPNIPNYGSKRDGPVLRAGMTIAIEPMATLGDYRVKTDADGWTIRTSDGSLSAHFEHTVVITKSGAEILTTSQS